MKALPSLARLESLSVRGMKLGLAAIDAVCERLGRPERRVASVLIGGTNGKGSTAATLSSIARAAGLRAGLYTSPHLIRVTERIRVEERDVSEEELDEILRQVFVAADSSPEIAVTYFEAITAAAFLLFAGRGLDLAILEVGLGGRFDATNVVAADLSLVTSIGLDHTEELGSTLDAIAREKAGIFRAGKSALVRADSPLALTALESAGRAAGAVWHDAGRELAISEVDTSLTGTRFRLRTPARDLRVATPLPGRHQAWNTALAIRATELLGMLFREPSPSVLRSGLAAVRWPGRLESIAMGRRRILLDGCHNPQGASALAEFLDQTGLAGRCPLVFGAMADKPVEEIADLLLPRASLVRLVTATSSRAATAEDLLRRVGARHPSARPAASLEAALTELHASGGSEPIIVAGSLYLVGQARSLLLESEFARRYS